MSEPEPFSVKKRLLENWAVNMSKSRSELHIADILHCRRRVCFSHLDPNPEISMIDQRKAHFIINGQDKHLGLRDILGYEDFVYEKEINYTTSNNVKIVGHADAVYKDGTVIEFKTTESGSVAHKPYDFNVQQVLYYAAMLNSSRAILLYLIFGSPNRISNYFPEYHFSLTSEERQNIIKRLELRTEELQNAIDKRDVELADHIAGNFTYLNKSLTANWYCENSCPYKLKCSGYQKWFGAQGKSIEDRNHEMIQESLESLQKQSNDKSNFNK